MQPAGETAQVLTPEDAQLGADDRSFNPRRCSTDGPASAIPKVSHTSHSPLNEARCRLGGVRGEATGRPPALR